MVAAEVPSALREVEALADRVVCLLAPPSFRAVGAAYRDFAQTTDDQVRDLLRRRAQHLGHTSSIGAGRRGRAPRKLSVVERMF